MREEEIIQENKKEKWWGGGNGERRRDIDTHWITSFFLVKETSGQNLNWLV